MSTQKDIYAAGSESLPPMLNKENYVPWSSRLLRYAKSRPNGKLFHNSILNGPYVRRMIPEPGDVNREVTMEADDQAIQTILLGLPEDIYAAVDSCEPAQKIWLRVQQMMKGSDIGIREKKAKLFNEWERFTSNEGESIEYYYHRFLKLMNDLKRNKHFPEKIASNLKFLNNLQPEWSRHVTIVHQTKDLHTTDYNQLYDFLKYNQNETKDLHPADYTQLYDFLKYNQKENYMQQPMPNPEDITDPTTAMNMALSLMAKAFKLNYSTPTNNNQRISSNPRNRQIAQPGQNARNLNGYNAVQNVGNQRSSILSYSKPIPEPQQVPQNDNNVISEVTDVEQDGETVEQHPTNFEKTRALYESLYQNLEVEVEKVNLVNRELKETIADLTTELARETVEQHTANFEETRVLYESLYQNLAIEVEKLNSVNRKLNETNTDLTTKLARFKN
nr:hypothetical protein [Tanacetum cinerariifolium]